MFPIVFRVVMGVLAITLGCVAFFGGVPPILAGGIGSFAAAFGIYATLGMEK